MVYRAYVEKKKGLDNEAQSLKNELVSLLGISTLENVRILNRYDVEGLEKELFDYAKTTVLSEPQLDIISEEPNLECDRLFATEFLPGQFDQRANSCAECIQMISKGERPLVRSAKVYCLYGNLSDEQLEQIKKYVINPVEAREATLEKPETLAAEYDIPESVRTLDGFIGLDEKGLADFVDEYGLAMDLDDIKFCQNYFISEQRDPTITEIRMIDTYWSDHCRHTTFLTNIDSVKFEDELLQKNKQREKEAFELAKRKIAELGLDITLISAEYNPEKLTMVLYFRAENRVDLRSLVLEIAGVLRMKTELRQIK